MATHAYARLGAIIGWLLCSLSAQAADPLLRDGDRLLLVGNTLFEREPSHGGWELNLLLAEPRLRVTVRNLGWSGDTVWAESRGIFDAPAVGYQRLLELIRELQPTVILLGYGSVEAFTPERLPAFRTQYEQLCRDCSATGARLLHLAPLPLEASQLPGKPDAARAHAERYHASIEDFTAAIAEVSSARNEALLNLQPLWSARDSTAPPLTENGQQLSAAGYASTGAELMRQLGLTPTPVDVALSADLAPLREAVREKNLLFFHRWRPQNFTYLFGFRSYEQGQNASEIARFDPLIEAAEHRILELRDAISIAPAPAQSP